VNESLDFIPLPLLCCVAEVDLGKSPTGLDRPTALAWLCGLKSFENYDLVKKGFFFWSAMGLAP